MQNIKINPGEGEKSDTIEIIGAFYEEVALPEEMSRSEITGKILKDKDFRLSLKEKMSDRGFKILTKEL